MVGNVVAGMVFARALTVADYGTYLQTFLAYDFAVPVLTLGLPSALYYFLPGAKERKKGLVLDNLVLLFLAGLVFSLFLLLGGTELLAKRLNNPELSKTLRWMVFYPIYTFPVLIASAVWVTQDKVKLNAKYNVFTGIALTFSLIISALVTRSYEAPTLVRILLPIVFFPAAIYLIFKYVPGDWYKPSLTSMWNMAKFAIPLGLASVFGTLTIQLAGIIVSYLTSPEEYAIYANGAKEIPLIGIVTGSISVVIMADMAKNIKEGNLNIALELFRKSATLSAIFLLPIMVFLMIFADSFINILYSSKYELSVLPFRIYLFMLPVRIVYYGAAFIALGKTKAILFRSFIELILTAVLAYLLTKYTGYNGAAIATVSMYYIWAIPYNLRYLGKQFNCRSTYIIPFKQIGIIFLISIFAGIISLPALFINNNSLISITVGILIFGVVYYLFAHKYISEFREIIEPVKMKINRYL
jgi:O-antigen/teichoic acid export membrane protein